jgi:hypothetical protein
MTLSGDNRSTAVIIREEVHDYPHHGPFHPSSRFPECPFPAALVSEDNEVYAQVRDALRDMGLDQDNFGLPAWDPLGDIISPGDTVLI